MKTRPIHIATETYEQIKAYATANAITIGDATQKLVATAMSRKAALVKYAKKDKQQ